MEIKKLGNYKFKDAIGTYVMSGYGLYVEGKGFVTLDGDKPYTPVGGKRALQSILEQGGFTSEPQYIQPVA